MFLRGLVAALAITATFDLALARETESSCLETEGVAISAPSEAVEEFLAAPVASQSVTDGGVFLRLGSESRLFVSQTEETWDPSGEGVRAGNTVLGNSEGTPSMQGLVTFTGEGADFLDCRTGKKYPFDETGDFAALEHAYLAAGKEPGVSILSTFDGELLAEDETDASSDGEAVRVQRFVGVWPDVSCERAMSQVSLTNTYWKVLSIFDSPINVPSDGKDPHIILLAEESRYTATVGCNQFMGSYVLDGSRVTFGRGAASTRVACWEPQAKWEELLRALIADTRGWKITNGMLRLLDAEGRPIAVFESVSLN
jgi:heat shock protein HslJ